MSRIGLSVAAVALCVCGISCAPQQSATPVSNEDAVGAARAVVEQGLAAVEKLDAQGLMALSTTDLVAYDIDLENKPVRMGSANEAVAYVAGISAEAQKMGATVRFDNVQYDCHATSDMAYCLLEYSFVATLADSTRMAQPSQTTVVLTKNDGAWKWAHWHTSLSAAPTSTGTK